MDNPSHYRNKNQIVFKNVKGGKSRIASGFYEAKSHNVVEFETCYTQDEESDKIVATIKDLMIKMHFNAYDEDRRKGILRHVLIKKGFKTNRNARNRRCNDKSYNGTRKENKSKK
mgnify:CR=1 FL=1